MKIVNSQTPNLQTPKIQFNSWNPIIWKDAILPKSVKVSRDPTPLINTINSKDQVCNSFDDFILATKQY